MSVDDAIRSGLERLVQELEDPDAVVAEVERRQARRRRRRMQARAFAAAVVVVTIAIAGVVTGAISSDSDEVTAGPPDGPPSNQPTAERAGGPTVALSGVDLGPLQVSTTELRPSEHGWLEHTVTIENTGTEAVHLNDHRSGEFLGDRQILAGIEGCGYAFSPGEPVHPVCQMDFRAPTIEPGGRVTFEITLWRGLEGMNESTPGGRYVYRTPILFNSAQPYAPGDQHGTEGQIVMTYANLPLEGGSVLRIPASGASPEQLDDGTPVWVVRHDDGTVSVLDAASTHTPFGVSQLVGWCARVPGFEDPAHGSAWDEWGRKRGGPAPGPLARYPTTLGDHTVAVTGAAMSPPHTSGVDVVEHCLERGDTTTLLPHSIADEEPMSVDQALRRSDGHVVLVDAPAIVLERGKSAIVCTDALVHSTPPACEGVEAPELSLFDDREWAVLRGDFVARVAGDTLTDIAFVGPYRVEGPTGG